MSNDKRNCTRKDSSASDDRRTDRKKSKNKNSKLSSNSSGRFPRSNNRDQRRASDDKNYLADSTAHLSSLNDLSWYNQYPELLSEAASIPFPLRPGMSQSFGVVNVGSTTASYGQVTGQAYYSVPGVAALKWYPSLGQSEFSTDPASIVGKEIYAKVRSQFSGALAADAPDFVMYLMALDSIFSAIGSMKRVYRLLTSWSPGNYIIPDAVLFALGVSWDQLVKMRSRRDDLLYVINELVLQSRKFTCPAIMDIFNRHYWLNDNVYMDTDSIRGQFYVFRQMGMFILDPEKPIVNDMTNSAAGLNMISLSIPSTEDWIDAMRTRIINAITALDSWDDGYTISGYLAKAYEGVPSFEVSLLSEDERVTPVYSDEVLTQIENAFGSDIQNVGPLSRLGVAQNVKTNSIYSKPYALMLSASGVSVASNNSNSMLMWPRINMHSDSVTAGEVVIASRLLNYVNPTTSTIDACLDTSTDKPASFTGYLISCGTEMFCGTEYWINNGSGVYSAMTPLPYVGAKLANAAATGDGVPALSSLLTSVYASQFKRHPITYLVANIVTGNLESALLPLGDVFNMTTLSPDQLQRIHRVCLFSEFNSFRQ